jgi:hypothetical protein
MPVVAEAVVEAVVEVISLQLSWTRTNIAVSPRIKVALV